MNQSRAGFDEGLELYLICSTRYFNFEHYSEKAGSMPFSFLSIYVIYYWVKNSSESDWTWCWLVLTHTVHIKNADYFIREVLSLIGWSGLEAIWRHYLTTIAALPFAVWSLSIWCLIILYSGLTFSELGIWLTVNAEPMKPAWWPKARAAGFFTWIGSITTTTPQSAGHRRLHQAQVWRGGKRESKPLILGGWSPVHIPSRRELTGTSHCSLLASIWYFFSGDQNTLLFSNLCLF